MFQVVMVDVEPLRDHAGADFYIAIPRFIPHTKPTPSDESDIAGQDFFGIRMKSTPPDHSDGMQPPHNPSVVGSIPTGPTKRTY
jgi:hypothetical protein